MNTFGDEVDDDDADDDDELDSDTEVINKSEFMKSADTFKKGTFKTQLKIKQYSFLLVIL